MRSTGGAVGRSMPRFTPVRRNWPQTYPQACLMLCAADHVPIPGAVSHGYPHESRPWTMKWD